MHLWGHLFEVTNLLSKLRQSVGQSGVPVKASNLSPMKIAASYWCLFKASCRQLLRNSSIFGFEGALPDETPRFRVVMVSSDKGTCREKTDEGSMVVKGGNACRAGRRGVTAGEWGAMGGWLWSRRSVWWRRACKLSVVLRLQIFDRVGPTTLIGTLSSPESRAVLF